MLIDSSTILPIDCSAILLWVQGGASAWSASKDGGGGGHSGGADNMGADGGIGIGIGIVSGVDGGVYVVIGVAVTVVGVVVTVAGAVVGGGGDVVGVAIVVKMTRGGSGRCIGGMCSSSDSERKELIGS